MSWRSIAEISEGTNYSNAATLAVSKTDAQLNALKTFLAETEETAATDPNLTKMRSDVEALYNDTLETLDQISADDLKGAGNFYAVGALAQISSGLDLTIDIPDSTSGGGTVANFYRSANIQNSEEALAIEDPGERAAYVEMRREKWANNDNLESMRDAGYAGNAFALATLDAAKAQNDPNYTPNPERNFEGIAGMSEEAHKMMRVQPGGKAATDPIDLEANMLYRTLDAYRYADIEENPGILLSPEMQSHVQETNLNVIARAMNGEYGDEIRIMGLIEDGTSRVGVSEIDPSDAMRALSFRSGITFNPLEGWLQIEGGQIKNDAQLPGEGHIKEFMIGDYRAEQEQHPEMMGKLTDLVENSNGQRISTEEIYTALGRDSAGPDFTKPTPRVMANIERDINGIEERIALMEELVANPQGKNFQDVLAEQDTSIEWLMLELKADMAKNWYDAGLDSDTYKRLYEEGNFDQRMEVLLGVPLDQSQKMTLADSPLLLAMEKNFHAFHPAKENTEEIPDIRDGSSQLGAALAARGGAVIIDNHSQAEPLQFLYDSLPEIASGGSTVVLLENASSFIPQGLVDLTQTHDPIRKFYETGDASHLEKFKNSLTVDLLEKQEKGPLNEQEQAQLAELQERDALFIKVIKEGYTEHGIKFQYFGGGLEGDFADEFGHEARMVTTNSGWDEKINAAGAGYDNVIVFAGGGHFVENIITNNGTTLNLGRMGLDESLGYPTFSLANPGGLLRGLGDYNLAPTQDSGRWVPTGDPLASETQPVTQDRSSDVSVTPVAPNQ